MYKHDALLKLKNLIKLYEKKIFTSDDSLGAFTSLIQFEGIYEKIFESGSFDILSFYKNHPRVFDILNKKIEDSYVNKYNNLNSFSDFSLNTLPNLLDNTIDKLDISDKEFIIENSIRKEDIVGLVNEFFKYEKVEDPEIFNKFIKDKRVLSFDCNNDMLAGIIYFDSVFNKDYICVNNVSNESNLSLAATCVHECGHALDVLGLPKSVKSKYVNESLLLEASSYYIENKFFDFLLKENINKEEAQYEKLNLLFCMEENLLNCITYFENLKNNVDTEDVDIFYSVQYGYGRSLGIIFGEDKESLEIFKKLHYNVFDASLLDRLNINEDKCKKVFCKEIDKIYK